MRREEKLKSVHRPEKKSRPSTLCGAARTTSSLGSQILPVRCIRQPALGGERLLQDFRPGLPPAPVSGDFVVVRRDAPEFAHRKLIRDGVSCSWFSPSTFLCASWNK